MANIFQKITFNEHNYQQPDDRGYFVEKKLFNHDNYITMDGIGHESWNFNKKQLVDGKLYGYIYNNSKKLEDGLHNVFFYHQNKDGKLFIVGYYKNCNYLNNEQRKQIKDKLEHCGITDKRIQDTYEVTKNSEFDELNKFTENDIIEKFKPEPDEEFFFNFKLEVDPKNVFLLENPIQFHAQTFLNIVGKKLYNKFGNYNLISDEKLPLFLREIGLSF